MEYSATTAITCLIAAAAFSSFSTVSVSAQNQAPVASSTLTTVKQPVQSAPTGSPTNLRAIGPEQVALLTVPWVPVKTTLTTSRIGILQPPCAPGTGPGAPTTPPVTDVRGTTSATPSMPAAPGSPPIVDAIVQGTSNPALVPNK
jgi:hypothetical protein